MEFGVWSSYPLGGPDLPKPASLALGRRTCTFNIFFSCDLDLQGTLGHGIATVSAVLIIIWSIPDKSIQSKVIGGVRPSQDQRHGPKRPYCLHMHVATMGRSW